VLARSSAGADTTYRVGGRHSFMALGITNRLILSYAAVAVLAAKRMIPKIMQDLLLGLPGNRSGTRRMDFESSSSMASESRKG
jgi:hypothetical protein